MTTATTPGSLTCEECDYSARSLSGLMRHKCDSRRADQLTAESKARRAAGDRSPQPCHHARKHAHGTSLAYMMDGCGCPPCTMAHTAEKTLYKRSRKKVGGGGYVPAEPVREHLDHLLNYMTLADIEAVSGVQSETISQIRCGVHRRMQHTNAEALMSVAPRPQQRPGFMNPTGTVRRLRGLVAEGWPIPYLAERLGTSSTTLQQRLRDEVSVVKSETRAKVIALTKELGKTTPPRRTGKGVWGRERYRAYAKAKGWAPLASWDDIDNPRERPKGAE